MGRKNFNFVQQAKAARGERTKPLRAMPAAAVVPAPPPTPSNKKQPPKKKRGARLGRGRSSERVLGEVPWPVLPRDWNKSFQRGRSLERTAKGKAAKLPTLLQPTLMKSSLAAVMTPHPKRTWQDLNPQCGGYWLSSDDESSTSPSPAEELSFEGCRDEDEAVVEGSMPLPGGFSEKLFVEDPRDESATVSVIGFDGKHLEGVVRSDDSFQEKLDAVRDMYFDEPCRGSLLQTRDAFLVEQKTDAGGYDSDEEEGRSGNVLGALLMLVRDEIQGTVAWSDWMLDAGIDLHTGSGLEAGRPTGWARFMRDVDDAVSELSMERATTAEGDSP